MKKNKMMRIASVLLVAVLLSTCAISGTYAKYTTSVTNQDSARVARWGFTGEDADIAITDLFKSAYDKNVGGYADVIAPGTTNSANFIFEYTAGTTDNVNRPEVAYTFTVDTTGSDCAATIKANPNIKWAVYKFGTTPAWGSWDDMIDGIKKLSGDDSGTKEYGAQAELPPICELYTIAWQWIFDEAAGGVNNDANDTLMGNADDLADVKVVIKVTATQLD